jgi:endonuclease/exonuclease/phosphatase family metal-dependent hydrolase
MYGIHLKSRLGSETDAVLNRKEREGEATAVRNCIAKDAGAGMWILAGDTNDSPGSGTWKRLSQKGDMKLGTALRALDSNGEAWTYHYTSHDVYERIDMLLCSPPMCEMLVEGSAKIFDGPGSEQASDHRLIYVDLDFPDIPAAAQPEAGR